MIIKTDNLTKQYQHKDGIVNAIDKISLEIEKGSFVTITGKSGSGKTTLLLILGGLLKPTSGQLFFNSKVVNTSDDKFLSQYRSENVGFVMQNFALIPYLTAVENIMVALALNPSVNGQAKDRAIDLLNTVGLEDRINHYPKELSAGQQQRVAIARALANKPQLILADEPTGNLDPSLSQEILQTLRDINIQYKTTIIMVTHSPVAAEFGNRKIQLDNGKIINQFENESNLKI
jgi:putative ABC transport system ATP-binding protein